jgi:hypothetical protein
MKVQSMKAKIQMTALIITTLSCVATQAAAQKCLADRGQFTGFGE